MRWIRWSGLEIRRIVIGVIGTLAWLGFYLVAANLIEILFRTQFGFTHRQAVPYAVSIGLMITIVAVMILLVAAIKLGWIDNTMYRYGTLPCTALDPNDEIEEGWYVAEFNGVRIMAEVVNSNCGLKMWAAGREWSLCDRDLPVRLIARTDLDRLNIHPPEADFIRAQIATVKGFLLDRTEKQDPIGHRQWKDRLKDLEGQLASLEGRA